MCSTYVPYVLQRFIASLMTVIRAYLNEKQYCLRKKFATINLKFNAAADIYTAYELRPEVLSIFFVP